MKITLRLLLAAMLLMIAPKLLIAQNPTGPTVVNVIPPSPEAQSFMRYGQIPVDVSTGVPNIEIPLYQITSGKLSLPVSISYHSSGIKVNDIAGVVGLGWRLSAGGVLTKAVLGKSDNDPSYGMLNYPYRTKSQIDALPQNGSEWDRLNMISKGQMDGESDKYFYSAGDRISGEFIYSNSLNIIQTTSSDNKVISLSPTSYQVIADDGTKYYYEAVEYTRNNLDPPYISSWWLSKIVSADDVDTITFEYETSNSQAVSFAASHSLTLDGLGSGVSYNSSQIVNTPILLKKINFRSGYISFDYQGGRLDMLDYKLSTVSIYAAGSTSPLKKYQFSQSYFNSAHDSGYSQYSSKFYYRMKLDQLSVYDAVLQNTQNYSFEYDQQYDMPPYVRGAGPNDDSSCWSQDYFGYLNGASNQHLIAGYLPTPNVGADRSPDYAHAKTCVLKKINYPTGGSTSFEYQLNDGSAISPQIAGGLRIHRIISTTNGTTVASVKRFEYSNNMLQLDFDYFNSNVYEWEPLVYNANCNFVTGNYTTYISEPILPFANFSGSSAIYQNVEEYDDDNIANSSLKKSYFYTVQNDAIISIDSKRFHNQYYREIPWKKGQLQNVSYYKNKPITGYFLNKSETYSYTDFRTDIVTAGTKIERIHPIISNCTADAYGGGTYQNYFTYFDVPIGIGISKLTNVTTIETDNSGNSVTSSKTTSFDSPYHLFPTSTTTITSTGDQLVTQYKYPIDFSGTSPYDQMYGILHVWSPVIQQDEYKNSTFIRSSKTDFSLFNGIPLPAIVSIKKGPSVAGNYDPRIQYLGYDSHGLIQSTAKVYGVKTCYLYSYNGVFPVAQVTNADYNSVLAVLGGQTAVDNFRDNPSPSDATVNAFLAPLRMITDAQVTTFTYQPLVGMTSQTDPKGMTTYYGYDNFQRLITVKNRSGEILKTYCYNYAGQLTDCNSSAGGTTPTTPTVVYARVEVLNPTWNSSTDWSTTEGDVYIALFSDANCTQPVSLPHALDVNVNTAANSSENNVYSFSTWTNTYTVPANTNRVLLGRFTTDSWYSYYDPYYEQIINSYNYFYQVEDNGLNTYTSSPTYTF